MDEMNLTEDEARELRRIQRMTGRKMLALLVVSLLSSVSVVVGFLAWRAWSKGESGFHVDGDLMFLPVIVVVAAIVILAPQRQGRPAGKIELVIANRRERWMPWVLLVEAVLTLCVAGEYALSQRFSIGLILFPLFVLGLLRFPRPNDELGQAIAQRAMVAGFLAAFATLTAMILTAAFAPGWLVRLAPMGLAIPMTAAAITFALASWRADRDA